MAICCAGLSTTGPDDCTGVSCIAVACDDVSLTGATGATVLDVDALVVAVDVAVFDVVDGAGAFSASGFIKNVPNPIPRLL